MSATFRILGPLEVVDGEQTVALGGPRQRALLAILLLHANEVVSTDRLIDELWGEVPPPTARQTVQVYVSQLRRAIHADGSPNGTIETRSPGYVLHVDAGQLDLDRFDELYTSGREALGAGDAKAAAAALRQALDLWRGAALADFAYEPFAQHEIDRLEERRVACVEERIEADLQLGRHHDLVGELEALVAEHPVRERLRGQLMIALYATGRQAEALEQYASGRRALADEFGIEPSGALKDLERRILTQDPTLTPPPAKRHVPRLPATPARLRGPGRLRWAAGGAALLVAAGIGIWLAAGGDDRTGPVIPGDSIVAIDARSGRGGSPIEVGGGPSQLVLSAGAVWVAAASDGALRRIDPEKGSVVQSVALGGGPDGLAAGGGSVWATSGLEGKLVRISPETNAIVQTVTLPNGPRGVAFGEGAVWVASRYARVVSRIAPDTGAVVWSRPVGGSPIGIAAGGGAVWATNETDATVSRIDPRTGRVSQRIGVGNGPGPVQVHGGSVWVANTLDGTVSRIDAATNAVTATITVGEHPASLAAGAQGVWVANELGGTVMRIDPDTNTVVETIATGQRPAGLVLDGRRLWVAARDASATHRGGTLRVGGDASDLGSIDQVDYSLAWLNLTGDGLTAFRRVAGADGAGIVPDLAVAIPTPADNGRTYTFQLRRGVRYSSGEPVGPEDFRRAIERFFRLGPGGEYYGAIVGAAQCRRRPARCDLSRGIVVDAAANTVTFHLTRPDPDLIHTLALPFAHAVAPSAPRTRATGKGLPATGPYVIASYRPGREVRFVRNPHFREWSRAARPDGYPDEILVIATPEPGAVSSVEQGRLDAMLHGRLEAAELERLAVLYPDRLRVAPVVGTFIVALNTTRPPFDRLDARRAVAYAIDREALIRIGGGSRTAQPTCQVLPPDFPGYEPYCPYTQDPRADGVWSRPDLDEAKRLVARSGTAGAAVVVRTWPEFAEEARHVAQTLRQLGYRASARTSSPEEWLADAYGPGERNPVQIGLSAWVIDYPAPSTFFEQLRCGSADPARFCDPAIDRQMDAALALQNMDPAAADKKWTAIDRALTDRAAWIGYATPRKATFLGSRVGNFQFHPVWWVMLDQLWVG